MATAELKPFSGVTITVVFPDEPAVTVTGVALRVKVGFGTEAVTVRATVVVAVRIALVPVTVSEYCPTVTFEPTLTDNPEPPPKPGTGFVRKVPVMPAGQPVVESVTAALPYSWM